MKKNAVILLLMCLSFSAHAQQLMKFVNSQVFTPENAPRVGIEVEMSGLRTKEIALIVQSQLGGVMEVVPNEYGLPEYHLQRSSVGRVVIKPEDNSSSANANIEENFEKSRITEIVTDPIHYAEVEKLQVAMDVLKSSGATGTAQGLAVSIQVNVEIAKGDRSKATTKEIIDLVKNFLNPSNRADLAQTYKVPEFRRKYLGDFSPGFMKVLNRKGYAPSWRHFYDDFMYRQTLEVMGYEDAWKMPIKNAHNEVMTQLQSRGFEAILPVVKWNYVRLSSMMMYMFPEDPLSKFLVETSWFKAHPLFENREPNNDFNVVKATRETVGLKQLSEQFGHLRADHPEDYQRYMKQRARTCSGIFLGN